MTEPMTWISETYNGLADLLAVTATETWDAPSLCDEWQVRHVVAHATMPARFTLEEFGAEMAAAGGDFTQVSNSIADRDAQLPRSAHLDALRSPQLHAWEPPGGGAPAALSHAVIHCLDVTIALGQPSPAPIDARIAVLNQLVEANGELFGVDLTDLHLRATDIDWEHGSGRTIRTDSSALVALLSARTLPGGQSLALS